MEKMEIKEDRTKYGEFISSYFAWLTLDKQKEIAEDLEEIGKENNNSKNR